jgi:hypothetical protein
MRYSRRLDHDKDGIACKMLWGSESLVLAVPWL